MTIGTATMRDDKSILLMLRAEGDGYLGDAEIECHPGEDLYDEVMRHVPGLEPGVTRPVEPWPDEPEKE